MTLIKYWTDPAPEDVGSNIEQFIQILQQPACITLAGADPSRDRVLVTLLHGNEPSGLYALHKILREGVQPAANLHCYIIATAAALLKPRFSHRQVPGKRDYNRCFKGPFDEEEQARVSRQLLDDIKRLQPEAVVDMHNTTGEGPSFAVAKLYDKKHDQIISLFTDRLILTDLQLGSLMEVSTHQVPVVTIECGGVEEDASHQIAYEGLMRFFSQENLFIQEEKEWGLEIFSNPVRVELTPQARLNYGEHEKPNADLTLRVDIEHYNFQLVGEDTCLGWVSSPCPEGLILALDPNRQDHFESFYYCRGGKLYTRTSQKMFMITSNAEVARSDCLWYAVKA